jgi:hypothetical protein
MNRPHVIQADRDALDDLGLDLRRTAPVGPGVDAPGGDRSNPTNRNEEKGCPMLQPPTDPDQNCAFEGDRYERLVEAAKVLAADEKIIAAESPYNSEGLMAFARSIAELKLLYGLSDYDSNTVALLVVLDFLQGPRRMAWRIYDMLTDETQTPVRDHHDEIAVIYSMVGILRMVVGAWLEPDPLRNLTALYADVEEVDSVIKQVAGISSDAAPFREAAADLLTAKDAIADAIEALQ